MKGVIRVLDRTGDKVVLDYDLADPATVRAAEEYLRTRRKAGFLVFDASAKEMTTTIGPQSTEMVVAPPMVGG